jgi:hypothetical protein
MLLGIRGTSNTISNSSTIRGWLESTGLDDIFLGTCSCIFGEEEPPGGATSQPQGAGGRRNRRVVKAGTTVDGTPLLIQETSLGMFGLAPLLGGRNR